MPPPAPPPQALIQAHLPPPSSLLPSSAQVSRISRESINALKECFADEMTKDDWRLVLKLKKTFSVI